MNSSSSRETEDEKPSLGETREELQPNSATGLTNRGAASLHEAATTQVETKASADHSKVEPCDAVEKEHLEAAPEHANEQLSEGFQLQSGAGDGSAVVLPAKLGLDDKHQFQNASNQTDFPVSETNGARSEHPFLSDGGSPSGAEEEQSAFVKELAHFFRERNMEFKHPKFYGEELNCLKLWRTVMKLGGYDKVTSSKMWRHVGDSFKPPKTCTTVSWTFRGFYEKALLDYERYKTCAGELNVPAGLHSESLGVDNQASGSGRGLGDSAARAWYSPHHLVAGEVSDPAIKDMRLISLLKREKQVKGLLKRKKPDNTEDVVSPGHNKTFKLLEVEVADIGTPAEWVKITVQETKDCYEVYALVPGLLREEVRVQSDPAGRLVISGEPQNPDNPWGVRPFKKIVNLPSKIEPHLTSAVVTLHGQLFVRAPFNQNSS